MAGQQHYERQIHGQMVQAPQAVSVAQPPAARNGLWDLAGEAVKAGQEIFQTGARMYGQARQGLADETLINVDRQMDEYKQEYYRSRRGVDALTAQEDFARKYAELSQAALKDFGGDEHDVHWTGLRRNLMARHLHAFREGGSYALQQGQQFQKSSLDGQLAVYDGEIAANLDDPHWLEYRQQELIQKWQEANPGLDPTSFKQKLAESTNEKRVQTLLAHGRYQDAINLLSGGQAGTPVQGGQSGGADISDNGISGGRAGIGHFDPSARIGYALSHHESGKEGIRAAGPDSKGTISYGKWQLNDGSGSYREWLASIANRDETGREIAAKLMPFAKKGVNQKAALAAYKELAGKYGEYMEATQYEYIHKTHYQFALDRIKSPALRQEIDGNRALQEMLFSTAVQHGGAGAASILNKSWKDGASLEDFIRAVYQRRGGNFPSSSAQVQAAVKNRYKDEVQEVLGILNGAMPAVQGNAQGAMPAMGGGLAMDPARRMHYLQQAQSALAKQNEVSKVLLDAEIRDFEAQCDDGILPQNPPDARLIVAAHGQQALPILNRMQAKQELAIGLSMMRQASGPDQGQILEQFRPQPGSPNYDERQKTYQRLEQERTAIKTAWEKDPAAWLIKYDPETKAAYQKLFTQGGFTPENAAGYVASLKSAGNVRGLPDDVPLIDKDTAQRFADRITSAENPGEVAQYLYKSFGAYGNKVMQAVMPNCPTTIMLVCNTMRPHAAKLLLDAKRDKDFEKKIGEILNLHGADATDFRQRVVDELSDFTDTLLGGGNLEFASGIIEDTRLLALQYMSQGVKQSVAIERAHDEIVGRSYSVCENRNSHLKYRMPNAIGIDPGKIESAARTLLMLIDGADLVVPDFTAFSKKIHASTIKDMVQDQGYWLTNSDETGLVLYIGGSPVLGKDRKPFQKTWQEVLNAYQEPPKVQMRPPGMPVATGD